MPVGVFALVTHLIAAAIGFSVRYGWDRLQSFKRRRGLGALLSGIDEPTVHKRVERIWRREGLKVPKRQVVPYLGARHLQVDGAGRKAPSLT